mgnify:CR=1 FL=1
MKTGNVRQLRMPLGKIGRDIVARSQNHLVCMQRGASGQSDVPAVRLAPDASDRMVEAKKGGYAKVISVGRPIGNHFVFGPEMVVLSRRYREI